MSNARALQTPDHVSPHISAILTAPYCDWPADAIVRHFCEPRAVNYFPVIDHVETDRRKIDKLLNDEFEFNGASYTLPAPIRWTDNPSPDHEWLILLHKFYYAVGLGMAYTDTQDVRYVWKWMSLTDSWIHDVPLNFLPSDVAGRRIQNWIFSHYFFLTRSVADTISPAFYLRFLSSLSQQVDHICAHLTPARNHRTLELCAIFLAGIVFPEMRHAESWRNLAETELVRNIETDFLPDGVHCELSTDYHHLVLKNLLWVRRLAALNNVRFPSVVDDTIKQALTFAQHTHKPDGMIPSLSDGDSRSFLELLEQGHELYGDETLRYVASHGRRGSAPRERSKGFADSGYYILRSGWGEGSMPYEDERYLIFDCGPVGAGNHGHFDLLSFEVAAYGKSLIVDPGRYTYDESGETNWRMRFRETCAHNTVVVDRQNQTRYVFDKTRYKIKGPHPGYELRRFVTRPGFDFLHGIACSHEYPVVHERAIFFLSPEYWIVSDFLIADEPHDYDLLFHLADDAHGRTYAAIEEHSLSVHAPNIIVAQPRQRHVHLAIDAGHVSRTYGVKHPAPVIRLSCRAATMCFHTVLYPYQDTCPHVRIDRVPFRFPHVAVLESHTSALRITHEYHGELVNDYYELRNGSASHPGSLGEFSQNGNVSFHRTNAKGETLREHSC